MLGKSPNYAQISHAYLCLRLTIVGSIFLVFLAIKLVVVAISAAPNIANSLAIQDPS